MNLPLFIARRYLFARKSHNVINIISAISAVGMGIGTAALIIILSIYNGFDELVKSMMGNVEPDLLVAPAHGKVFDPDDHAEAFDWLYAQESVGTMCRVLQEQVFIDYGGKQGVAVAKGVDAIYEEESPLRRNVRNGSFSLHKGDVPMAVAGIGLAGKMGINPAFVTPIDIYFPSRTRKVSLTSPASSIETVRVWPSGVFSVNNDIDNSVIILPIEIMRELLEYSGEVTGVEVRLKEGTTAKELERIRKEASERLGERCTVLDRFSQNPALYKMMKYEKAAIFLILIFVIIIIAFNIFGSLSMLIIEKEGDIGTLRSLGADNRMIKRIFILEGWLISLLGLAGGMIVGVSFALLQQAFGLIRMPGNFVVSAYPVILSPTDLVIVAAGVAIIGYLTALAPVSRKMRGL